MDLLLLLFSCFFASTVISMRMIPGSLAAEHNLRYFYFPSPDEQVEIFFNDSQSLDASDLKPATKTLILLDGFRSNYSSYMAADTKKTFASSPEYNFVVVDWSYFNGHFNPIPGLVGLVFGYIDSMIKLPAAGEALAQFLNFLRIHKQIEFSDITFLTHSMGCHAAGATGRAVQRLYGSKIGRIVGMDPSLQYSRLEERVRLQVGDASVVEIYHTARMFLGDSYPATGDITIYPNGGEVQPCEEGEGAPGTEDCSSHSYSWKLYNYLLNNSTIKACPCRGAACFCKTCEFKCGDDAISIGPHIPENARGSYHVRTGYLDWN